MANSISKITHAVVRMYCMGTGDCFIIKFFAGDKECFKMMIDCGVWSGTAEHLTPYIEDLKEYVNNSVDLLVVTHEHKDHVSVFDSCKDLFTTDFDVKRIWMGWSENDDLSRVKRWKTQYGEKKKALAMAAEKIEKVVNNEEYKKLMEHEHNGFNILGSQLAFSASLSNFAELHLNAASGSYKGMLEGMRIVKKEIASDNIDYFYPGSIIEDIPGLNGIKFYVLGPPEKWNEVEEESGGEGESYTHNKELKGTDAFAASILSEHSATDPDAILPFDQMYLLKDSKINLEYKDPENTWRSIDHDWLLSAGSLALRVNSLTNNLSLALAIEFEDSKRVMLFPGDAEYGSWSSWHEINWEGVEPKNKDVHFTEDLLQRTVFYKVAHHMSHNGTAQRLGLNMMKHKDLAAMATLDYDVIAPGWKGTMPNREIIQELLVKTKGRLMMMNENGVYYDFNNKQPIGTKIKEARKRMSEKEKEHFEHSYKRDGNGLFVEYIVKGD